MGFVSSEGKKPTEAPRFTYTLHNKTIPTKLVTGQQCLQNKESGAFSRKIEMIVVTENMKQDERF